MQKIGTMKIFFTYPDMPMITFLGNPKEASVLLPEKTFDTESIAGQVAVTNMSRPNRGLNRHQATNKPGVRTHGRREYGTNIAGMVVGGLEAMLKETSRTGT